MSMILLRWDEVQVGTLITWIDNDDNITEVVCRSPRTDKGVEWWDVVCSCGCGLRMCIDVRNALSRPELVAVF